MHDLAPSSPVSRPAALPRHRVSTFRRTAAFVLGALALLYAVLLWHSAAPFETLKEQARHAAAESAPQMLPSELGSRP